MTREKQPTDGATPNPEVAVIILNWNAADDTIGCIGSVRAMTYRDVQVIVVDNGSTDGSVARLRDLPDVILVENPCNLGFTGGCNTGIRRAMQDRADYIWLLNSDARVEPGTLSQLVAAAASDRSIGLISPIIRDMGADGGIIFCCGLVTKDTLDFTPTNKPDLARAWQDVAPNQVGLHGTALLIRRSVIDAIGGLDDRFFAYWEDIDYSIRSAEAGFRNVALLECSIRHEAKAPTTSPGTIKPHYFYYMARNEILLWRKHSSSAALPRALVWAFGRQLRQLEILRGHRVLEDALLAGMWDGWRGVHGCYDPFHRMPEPFRTALARFSSFWLRILGQQSVEVSQR